jgi:hypothetical protein
MSKQDSEAEKATDGSELLTSDSLSLTDPDDCDHPGTDISRVDTRVDAAGRAETVCLSCGARLSADIRSDVEWSVDRALPEEVRHE